MKLPLATSFFFCALLFLFSNCESEKKFNQQNSSLLTVLNDSMYEKSISGQLDSAIYYAHKLLKVSLKENNSKFTKIAYNKLSRYHSSNNAYDSAIFYAHKFLKISLDESDDSSIKVGYNKLGYYHSKLEVSDSVIYFYDKVIALATQTNDTLWMAKANSQKGFYYKEIDSFPSAYKNFETSKNLYLEIDDTIEVGNKLLEIAYLQKKQGNFGASQLTAIEGLEYLESTNELSIIGGLHHILSVALKETGKLETAMGEIDKALALATDSLAIEKIGKKNIFQFKNTKANIFKDLKKYDEAITIYKDLRGEQKVDTMELKRINANLAHTLYLKNGFNVTSDSLLKNSLSYLQKRKPISMLFSTQLKLAQLYSKENKAQSLEYVNQALETAEKLQNPNSILEALEVRIENNLNEEDFLRYKKIAKQLEIAEEDLNYLYANERYNYNKIENEKIIAVNKANISDKKAAQQRNQSLGLLLLLLILLVVTYFIYQKIKRRHKIEKVKTVHATEVRIASKVHDELANDIHNLMSRLETSEPDKENVLDKLDVIYNNARDISKQNSSVETGKGFPEELSNLFRSYQSDEVNVILKKYDVEIWKGISSHIKITIYRVLQELLTNSKKHSNAALIVVSVKKMNKQLYIQYTDNGKGFDEEISKNGLLNAENRIHAIKGKLTFDTELHNGCKFSINIPV